MQFEIPAEMLQGGYGGQQQQQQQQEERPKVSWPKGVSAEVAPEFEWLTSTEWKGKTATYAFNRGGELESTLKECTQREGACGWAANKGHLYINTPTLGAIAFTASGSKGFTGDKAAQLRLEQHMLDELKQVEWTAVKAGPAGNKSRIKFHKIITSQEDADILADDLYEILGISPSEDQSKIKSTYRKLSVKSHPDKCPTSEKEACTARFDKIRQAYEVLSDEKARGYYDLGGMRLAKNIEGGWKEVEAQKAQLDGQLNQVPQHHPMRAQVEHQVSQQKAQFSEARMRPQIEKKFTSDDVDVEVPVTLAELYSGSWQKTFEFPRLTICRGCRANPESDFCKTCGRCPPEKKQIPQYANTIFGKQVVGHKEKEMESLERCRNEYTTVTGLKIGRGAAPGSPMKSVPKIGHQAPGKIPGTVHFKLAYADDDTYRYVGEHLYTVLTITLSEAINGFEKQWSKVGGDGVVTLKRAGAHNGQVLRISKKGMFNQGASEPYGDIYVRIHIEMPPKGTTDIPRDTRDAVERLKPNLKREVETKVNDDKSVWRKYEELDIAVESTRKVTEHNEL